MSNSEYRQLRLDTQVIRDGLAPVSRTVPSKWMACTVIGNPPTTVPSYFMVAPQIIQGTEVEGEIGSLGTLSGTALVLVLGPTIPKVGDSFVAHAIGGRWISQGGCGAPNPPRVINITVGYGRTSDGRLCRVIHGATVVALDSDGQTIDSRTTDENGKVSLIIPAGKTATRIIATKTGYTACDTRLNEASYDAWFPAYWPGYVNELYLFPEKLIITDNNGSHEADVYVYKDDFNVWIVQWATAYQYPTATYVVTQCDSYSSLPGFVPADSSSNYVLISWQIRIISFEPNIPYADTGFHCITARFIYNHLLCGWTMDQGFGKYVGREVNRAHQVPGTGICNQWVLDSATPNYGYHWQSDYGQVMCGSGSLVATGNMPGDIAGPPDKPVQVGFVVGSISATEP